MPPDVKDTIRVHSDEEVLSRAAAGIFTQAARRSLKSKDKFAVALSGGKTPVRTYQLLSGSPYRELLAWKKTHVFWGDERYVPGDDPNNNAHAAMEAFLSRVPIPKNQIHPIPTDQPPEKAAEHYETLLRKVFGNATPRFDLILLGLGEDGHTASLFPGTSILNEQEWWVKEVFLEAQNSYRISLTVPAIIEADQIVFLVKGANKARALKEVLEGPLRPQEFPAQMIKPKHGELIWLVDQDAAKELHIKM